MKIEDIINSPFTFTKRKNFTSCDTRPLWKSSLIVLILGLTGKDYSASLKKIHTANWITKKDTHLDLYLKWAGKDDRKRPNVRLEPAIDIVINIMVSNKLLIKNVGKIQLSETGIDLFNEIKNEEIFILEKYYLSKSKKNLTEAAVKRLFEGI